MLNFRVFWKVLSSFELGSVLTRRTRRQGTVLAPTLIPILIIVQWSFNYHFCDWWTLLSMSSPGPVTVKIIITRRFFQEVSQVSESERGLHRRSYGESFAYDLVHKLGYRFCLLSSLRGLASILAFTVRLELVQVSWGKSVNSYIFSL